MCFRFRSQIQHQREGWLQHERRQGGIRQKTDRGTAPAHFSAKTQRDVTGLLWCVQYAAQNCIWELYWRHVEKDVNTDFSNAFG